MKISSSVVGFAAVGMIFATSLALSSAATAATPNVTYVVASDITQGPPFGYDGWSNQNLGPLTSDVSGLVMPNGGQPSFGFAPTIAFGSATTLVDLATNTSFESSNPAVVFSSIFIRDGVDTAIILYSQLAGGTFIDPAILWQATQPIGSYPAFETHTLAEFDAEIALDPSFIGGYVDAVAAYNNGAQPESLTAFNANGEQFIFTPEPVFAAPTTISRAEFTSSGITITTTGFLPNETGIEVRLRSPAGVSTVNAIDADANGAISFTYIEPNSGAVAGAYSLEFDGLVPNTQVFEFDLTVATLAATGIDVAIPTAVGGLVFLAGIALALFADQQRRRMSPSVVAAHATEQAKKRSRE